MISTRLSQLSLSFCLYALACPYSSAAALQSVKQVAEIKNPENGGDDQFGYSVAIDADTSVVGAPQNGGGNGFAYVYVKSGATWNQAAKLTSGNRKSIQFGHSVAIGGNIIAVGTPDDNNNSGVVYLFAKPANGWNGDLTPTAQLSITNGTGQNMLGGSLAISSDGSVVAAGAVGGDPQAVYVFVEPQGGWVDMTTYNADLGSPNSYAVGRSVAMSGNTIVAGEIGTTKLQAAYVFTKPAGGWNGPVYPVATLTASDSSYVDDFSISVAFSGNTIVVGSPFHPLAFGPGAAYVYVEPKTGWQDMTQTAELSVPANYNLLLGDSVAVSGNLILAGAPANTIGHNVAQGSVFGYLKPSGGWKDTTSPSGAGVGSDGQANERFGTSMAISGNNVIVGAPYYGGSLQGAAYIFSLK